MPHCRRIEGVFDSFDSTPVASLAQVHRAVYQGMPILEKEVMAFPRQLERDLPELTRRYAEILQDLPVLIRDHLKRGLEQPDHR